MSRGGRRPNAGRKPGSKVRNIEERILDRATKRTRNPVPALTAKLSAALVAKLTINGQTPLDVMLIVMRHHFDEGNWDRAADVAAMAAPYMHAKLSATKVEFRRPEEMTNDELAAALAAARKIAANDGPGMGDPAGARNKPAIH